MPACTTGRVFVLKFKTSNKRMFFWMQVCVLCHLSNFSHHAVTQEPKADKDEELCKKVCFHLDFLGQIFYNKLINTVQVNENLNNPPAPGSARAGGGSGGGLPGGLPAGLDFNNLGDSELQNLLNNMSQQQLMQV